MPAQWEPCETIWLAWPHNRDTWPGRQTEQLEGDEPPERDESLEHSEADRFEDIPPAYAYFVNSIRKTTSVRILVADSLRPHAESEIEKDRHSRGIDPGMLQPVRWLSALTDDSWMRDIGPTFVMQTPKSPTGNGRSELLAINWRYNAWGEKYKPYDRDAGTAKTVAGHARLKCLSTELCLEGGALETDGAGRLLVHRDCILNDNRNPGLTQEVASQRLHQYLGVEEILWLDGGIIAGDDTDGHIDQLARFVDRENVVVATAGVSNDTDLETRASTGQAPSDEGFPGAEGLEDNYRQLKIWGTRTSPEVQVHRLPMPPAKIIDGQWVPQSYCNFLRLGPKRLLLPTFASPDSDQEAINILRAICPEVEIEPVPCEKISWGLGALNCLSCHQVDLS